MTAQGENAIRRRKSQTTLADVFCGLEPGDRLEYSDCYGQIFVGTVESLHGPDIIVMRQSLGLERLKAADYYLETVLRSED